MSGRRKYGYIYGGTVTFGGEVRDVDGAAWSLGRCDETRLRAVAVQDVSRTEGVPLTGMELVRFWYSEIVTEDRDIAGTAGADPFRPYGAPEDRRDTVDPFRPGSGHPCTGDA